MDSISLSYQQEDRQNKSIEDSEDKVDSKIIKTVPRTRIIRKNHKSKAKSKQQHESLPNEESKTFNVTSPFLMCESEFQKSQRIEHYLKHDIQNFYKADIIQEDIEELNDFVVGNFLDLKFVMNGNLEQIWPHLQPSIPQIWSYLEIVDQAENSGNRFVLFEDQNCDKKYCCFYYSASSSHYQVFEISAFELQLLKTRPQFLNLFRSLKKNYQASSSNKERQVSQIKTQIIYLYKKLCESTMMLQKKIGDIKENIVKIKQLSAETQPHRNIEDKYLNAMFKKLVSFSLVNTQVDYLNFFKNNQIIEQGYPPEASKINDEKDFEDFMKKKKNRKGKKARFALHSGCLGCLNCFYEVYNPLTYCQQCYVRFHRFCYPGYTITDQSTQRKETFCESCYNKKNNVPLRTKLPECDLCGIKGLLSFNIGNIRRVHIFCALLNGLWEIRDKTLFFSEEKQKNYQLNSKIGKCQICQVTSYFVHQCENCEKFAHVSCAFLQGWEIKIAFSQNETETTINMKCCGMGVDLPQNERRRKFINNYKKYAYNTI